MQLLGKSIDPKTKEGSVTLIPDDVEDMWYLYNLILVGDELRTSTHRKVTSTTDTGSSSSVKRRIHLVLQVTATQFDPQSGELRVSGKTTQQNEYVRLGSAHTFDLEPKQKLSLIKPEWDSVLLGNLEDACDASKRAEVAAVMMSDTQAAVCLITHNRTVVKARLESRVPSKRYASPDSVEKAMQRFYRDILAALQRTISLAAIKCVVLASPGFTKDQFYKFVCDEAVRTGSRELLDARSKFILAKSTSGHVSALADVLDDPRLRDALSETRAQKEVAALARLRRVMSEDETMGVSAYRAVYGEAHVRHAHEQQAIELLMVADSLFRSMDLAVRRRWVSLVDEVRALPGTEVLIFSTENIQGEELLNMGGVAAILRFPVPDPDF